MQANGSRSLRCEVVAIGTELLLGQIVDSNSAYIGEQLALAGIDSLFQVKVGDNHARIVATLRAALARSEAVICCGGLGPTQDDITREAIAEVIGVPLVLRPEIGSRIRAMFESRGRVMPENNLRQAEVPAGADVIPEMPGTAPGLICPVGDKVIYAVPGVPGEMREMLHGSILPDLRRRAGDDAVIRSRVLRTWGHSESGLAEMLGAYMAGLDRSGAATLAFQASGIEGIKVRLTVKAPDLASALTTLDREESAVRAILGNCVFGRDAETMESVVLAALARRGLSLAVAETATEGLLSLRLRTRGDDPATFRGGFVLSDGDSSTRLLGVASPLPADAAGTLALARAARERAGATTGLATTAIAAGASTPGTRPGTVHVAIDSAVGSHGETLYLPGDRDRIREFSVIGALNVLRHWLARSAS